MVTRDFVAFAIAFAQIVGVRNAAGQAGDEMGAGSGSGGGNGSGTTTTTGVDPEVEPDEPDPFFDVVRLLGAINATSGNVTSTEASAAGTGTFGVYAQGHGLTLNAHFAAGTDAEKVVSADDFGAFLLTPTASLGFAVQARYVRTSGVLRYGGGLNLRGGARTLEAAGADSQKVAAIAADANASLQVAIAAKRRIFLVAEVGLSMRFATGVHADLRTSLMLPDDNSFVGFQGLVALDLGDMYVGVQMINLGGNMPGLTDFALLPSIGVRGGVDLKEEDRSSRAGVGSPDALPPEPDEARPTPML